MQQIIHCVMLAENSASGSEFHRRVFGWTIPDPPKADGRMVSDNPELLRVIDMMNAKSPVVYVFEIAGNADAIADRVVSLGGIVVMSGQDDSIQWMVTDESGDRILGFIQ